VTTALIDGKLTALLDGDILLYEVGFACEVANEGIPPFDYAKEMMDTRIQNICALAGASFPPIVYLTGKGNFRYHIAKRQPYKQRAGNKPFHYANLKAYLRGRYNAEEVDGLEADDLIAIHQTKEMNADGTSNTIICTRDKDLRAVPGWHYGWEIGNQPSFGPKLVDKFGTLSYNKEKNKIEGTGLLFFLSQCLTGDPTDSIPGIPRMGPSGAFKILEGTTTYEDGLPRVLEAYKGFYGDLGEEMLLEQGRLLWMTRELSEDGQPVLWSINMGITIMGDSILPLKEEADYPKDSVEAMQRLSELTEQLAKVNEAIASYNENGKEA
jgi:hypothetical protein